ncbi:MAG: DUF1924 domain-containing protein [Burkholderiales bacterium]|nr:DUF1924 domain-containing protein [Burkholderiales bacterium]
MKRILQATCLATAVLVAAALPGVTLAATPAELLAAYKAQAGTTPSPERGQKLFNTDFGGPMGWSCSSCHSKDPTRGGRDELAEKPIAPLAPAANPKRFTDAVKVENAFRLNCKDVLGRECTAAEKADVISWLLSLKP